MAGDELGPLPAGRHGFSREQVAHHQRERLIAGLASAVAAKGYAALTLADVTAEARVSRRVFYEHFESKEECFLAAFEAVVAHLRELVAEAAAPEQSWPRQALAALRAALAFLAAEPGLAHLCLVEAPGAGPAVAERYGGAVAEVAAALRAGREELGQDERPLPDSTEDTIVGSLLSLLQRKVGAGEAEQLERLLPDCATLVLTPYLGAAEASRLASQAA